MEIRSSALGDLKDLIYSELINFYPPRELDSIVKDLLMHVSGLSHSMMVLERDRSLSESEIYFIQQAVKRLKKQEPLQYITGLASFRGLKIKVDQNVLIPRPETEELVGWVLEDLGQEKRIILDIGTGSACIALALKNEVPQANVHAIDISVKALDLARKNARDLGIDIIIGEVDILNEDARSALLKFDVIISNPPYVTPADRLLMQKNVTEYEPGLALFVDEKDPLIFYREIIKFSHDHLYDGGNLYFECNEGNANEVVRLLEKAGYADIQLRKDMQGKERMVRGVGC